MFGISQLYELLILVASNRSTYLKFKIESSSFYARFLSTGDARVNVVPNLSSQHIMFVRYHNLVAEKLFKINPHWDDERLYQEARKINIAVTQNIVYSEYLPIVVGSDVMDKFGLSVKPDGHHLVYDSTVDATVSVSFSTAAFRFGHTTVPNIQVSMMM